MNKETLSRAVAGWQYNTNHAEQTANQLDKKIDNNVNIDSVPDFHTFETARNQHRFFSNEESQAIHKAYQKGDLKLYLTNFEPTSEDKKVIKDPKRIARLYTRTTNVIQRNLQTLNSENSNQRNQTQSAIQRLLQQQNNDFEQTINSINNWCHDVRQEFPIDRVCYQELDSLDNYPNFKMQRFLGGDFITAFSDRRIVNMSKQQRSRLGRRIYLNPNIEVMPLIFEKILRMANDAGIELQAKMFNRVTELATNHQADKKQRQFELLGDSMVVYAKAEDADYVLREIIAISLQRPQDFEGRPVARIPFKIKDGLAIGDEPQEPLNSQHSLTTHRKLILDDALERTLLKTPEWTKIDNGLFNDAVTRCAKINGVNPNNIAFNADVA